MAATEVGLGPRQEADAGWMPNTRAAASHMAKSITQIAPCSLADGSFEETEVSTEGSHLTSIGMRMSMVDAIGRPLSMAGKKRHFCRADIKAALRRGSAVA